MSAERKMRRLGGAALVAGVAIAITGCSGGGGSSAAEYTLWDPYTQYDAGADWPKLIDACAADAGVTVTRTALNTADLTNKALLAGQQGNPPDILVVDNPLVSTLAEAGMLTTTETIGIDTSADDENQLSAGVLDGETYGVPIGANTLALFYNNEILSAAGVDPATITDWDSLTASLEKVTAAGHQGIIFSGVATEEGSFSFLPWFWGAGADLRELDSDEGVAALALLSDWVQKGYAPDSVLNDTQTVAWQKFEAGDFGFTENNTSYQNAAVESGLDYGIIQIPGIDGGAAPTPTGGEFVSLPIQKDTSRYDVSRKIVQCLTSTENLVKTDTALSYIAPTREAQEEQLAQNPLLQVWVDAVRNAKTRTGDNLGTDYPKISQPMWEAYQAALSGTKSPDQALRDAQSAAQAATE